MKRGRRRAAGAASSSHEHHPPAFTITHSSSSSIHAPISILPSRLFIPYAHHHHPSIFFIPHPYLTATPSPPSSSRIIPSSSIHHFNNPHHLTLHRLPFFIFLIFTASQIPKIIFTFHATNQNPLIFFSRDPPSSRTPPSSTSRESPSTFLHLHLTAARREARAAIHSTQQHRQEARTRGATNQFSWISKLSTGIQP